MKVISIVNQKSGVGKTSIAVNLSYGIASHGHRVLLIDADKQGSVKEWYGIVSEEKAFDVLHYDKDTLYKDIEALSKGYRYVVIDSPPGMESVTKSIMTVSDLVIIPVRPSILDIWSSKEIIELIKQAKKEVNRKLKTKLLVSQRAVGTRIGSEARDSLSEYGVPIFETEIHSRIAYVEAMLNGQAVMEYDPKSEAAREIINLTVEALKGYKNR